MRTAIGSDTLNVQTTRDPKASARVAEAVRRALLLVGPAESAYDERLAEDEIEELATS